MSGIEVREAGRADLSDIVMIRRSGIIAGLGPGARSAGKLDEVIEGLASPEDARRALSSPGHHLLVATVKGRAVGTAAICVNGDHAEFRSCYCLVRGQGVGSALMVARLELAADLRLRRAWLEVDDLNSPAIAHARRHGFRPVSRKPGKWYGAVIRFERELGAATAG